MHDNILAAVPDYAVLSPAQIRDLSLDGMDQDGIKQVIRGIDEQQLGIELYIDDLTGQREEMFGTLKEIQAELDGISRQIDEHLQAADDLEKSGLELKASADEIVTHANDMLQEINDMRALDAEFDDSKAYLQNYLATMR